MGARKTPDITPRLIPVKRAAEAVGLPYTSLRDVVHRGELKVILIGRAWYLERADIDRWIESKKGPA